MAGPESGRRGIALAVIGGGVMGRAIVEGGRRAGVLRDGRVVVAEPDSERRSALAGLGVRVAASAGDLIAGAPGEGEVWGDDTVVVLAVKPQMFAAVAAELAPIMSGRSERCVISIMAGVRSATIRERLGDRARVVRAMPNTPARVGQGVTAIAAGPGATEGDMAIAGRLFAALGPVVVRIDEGLMDAFTAVAGSGPAYLFYLAEAMERAAVEVGLDAAMARRVVAQTLRGAAALIDGDGQGDPGLLRAAVTSKRGTTAAAVASLERDGVMECWVRAIVAARDRGAELGRR